MNSRADGVDPSGDADATSDDEDTVLRPALDEDTVLRSAPDEGTVHRPLLDDAPTVQWPAGPGSGAVAGPAPLLSSSSDFIDRAPFGRAIVPDHAPIQRFDQRPRFEPPPSAPPAASPAAPRSAPPAPTPSAAAQPSPGAPSPLRPLPAPPPPQPPPGIDATTGPKPRGLLVPAIAFGCAMLLLLGIGGGLTALWLTDHDDATAPMAQDPLMNTPDVDPGVWAPLTEEQVPAGSPEELQQVLAENPLLEARLPIPAQCVLPPAAGGMLPAEELPGYLEAGAGCLETVWADALEPVGIAFEAPDVVVYTMDTLPTDSACQTANFTKTAPVVCHDDNTLYWPAAWDPGFSNTSATEAPSLYMWHLAYSYTMFALAAADLDAYYGALLLELADAPEQADEVQRRYALQVSCLSSAAAFQLPQGIRPAERVEDFVTSVEAQGEPVTAGDPAQESRAAWVGTGRDSRGSLGECSTWSAGADAVA